MTPTEFRDWMNALPPVSGSKVVDTRDPRHVGTVLAIWPRHATVRWDGNMESQVALAHLRRATAEELE
jgi:hypothetical protein